MCAKLKTQLLAIISTSLLSIPLSVSAQSLVDQGGPKSNKDNSPFSRYGIGDIANGRNVLSKGMGGTSTAYNDVLSVNGYNPASYGFLKFTTLDFALEARTRSITMGADNYTTGTGTISYLTIGIPMGKYAGMSLGLTPMSNVYYNANDTVNINGLGKSVFNYNGSGSLQYAYLGLAGKIKGFSLGFNVGYTFGSISNNSSLVNIDNAAVRNSEYLQSTSIHGIYWKGGLMYRAEFAKEHYLNLGATVTLSQKLNANKTNIDLSYLMDNSMGSLINIDTVRNTLTEGKVTMPAEYSFGAHYGKEGYWDIGTDLVYNDWKKANVMGDRANISDNAWRAAVGGEITPNPLSMNFFSRTTYRVGAYYGKDYITFNGNDVNLWGATVGTSLPLKRNNNFFGRVNLALDLGERGNVNVAKEFFVKFGLGLTFNDRSWFIKRKYN
jgi:hypothetical protein